MLRWQERHGRTGLTVTGRAGGVSSEPWDSLNLAAHVGDEPAAVAENRRRVTAALGLREQALVIASQVHGTRVVVVHGPLGGPPPEADGLVTAVPGLVLGVLVADCTPVLVAAPDEGLVGVAHAGRRGMAGGVVPELVEVLRAQGAGRLVARVGPSVCGRCYEVPLALREEVAAVEPVTRSVTRWGTPALDVAAGVLEQLRVLGVPAEEVPGCTYEDADLFSYRRARTTGRSAGLAWVEPPGAPA
ncbi:hypothetical protein EV189_3305 [Motilibacter rhizosphaerae]|uniref:Purine nucleoside phosphorylase n=1 Tax=Motilibacter rhizosphaerae TaxID=598652 RepID=A0A4Q7NGR0_9ACTN|nr:peptidoglycan editing factor PgeF [Motilibacter rhizosphaerae]RZS82908.1 hypothetical protein EV189_3305 [Motilibacter rhizosphaerae]